MSWYKAAQRVSESIRDIKDLNDIRMSIKAVISKDVPQNQLDIVTNFFVYLYNSENKEAKDIKTLIIGDWQKYKDYILTTLNGPSKNLLTTVGMTRQKLEQENDIYHFKLKTVGQNKGPEGETVVDVSASLSQFISDNKISDKNYNPAYWTGWSWVSLGCGFSSEEGSAAGHCGNAGASYRDNILSLRDPKGRVHLTFITNLKSGNLGESKGVNNDKPAEIYHPAIVALLSSGYIKNVVGGGYKPENNFKIEDIKNEEVKNALVGKMSTFTEHKQPTNYVTSDFISGVSQQQIDSLDISAKFNLLSRIFAAVNNDKIFEPYEEDEDGLSKNEIVKNEFKVPVINFDFRKLYQEVFYNTKNFNSKVSILKRLSNLMHSNKSYREDEFRLYNKEDEFNKDGTNIPIKGLLVRKEDLQEMGRSLVREQESIGINARMDTIDILRDVGEFETEEKDKFGDNLYDNMFKTDIEKMSQGIILSIAKDKKILNNEKAKYFCLDFITDKYGKVYEEYGRRFPYIDSIDISKDNQALMVGFNGSHDLYDTYSEDPNEALKKEKISKEIRSWVANNRNSLFKHGISQNYRDLFISVIDSSLFNDFDGVFFENVFKKAVSKKRIKIIKNKYNENITCFKSYYDLDPFIENFVASGFRPQLMIEDALLYSTAKKNVVAKFYNNLQESINSYIESYFNKLVDKFKVRLNAEREKEYSRYIH